MTKARMTRVAMMVVAFAALAACDKGGGASGLYKAENTPDNLKGLFATILKASESGDNKTAAALTRALIPDEAALKKALKDDAPADFVKQTTEMAGKVPTDDAQVAGLIKRGKPERTEIQVHGATTEEIKAYANDSVAFKEFPGGAKRLAEQVLRPGVTFYEVEMVEPGKDAGMKYHMFYWDGAAWRMLGPAWRGLH